MDSPRSFGILLLRDGDSRDLAAESFCGVHTETSPTAADFQHAISRSQMQATAEFVVFADLGRFQAFVRFFKIGTGIRHRRIQPESEEIITQIVMLPNVFLTHRTTVVPHAMKESVEGTEQIKQAGPT